MMVETDCTGRDWLRDVDERLHIESIQCSRFLDLAFCRLYVRTTFTFVITMVPPGLREAELL